MANPKRNVLDWAEHLCIIAAGAALMILMLLTTLDTFLRYFFSAPLTGVLEFSEEYLMIALIYLPISYVFIAGGHIKIELLERYFPAAVKRVVTKLNMLIGFLLFLLLTIASVPVVSEAIAIGEHSSSALAYPMAPAYTMVTIGCFLLCIRSVQILFGKIDSHH